jgi:hypothetical protein
VWGRRVIRALGLLKKAAADANGELDDDDILLRVVQPRFQQGDVFTSNAFQDQSAEEAATKWGLGGPCASVAVVRLWRDANGTVSDLLAGFDEGSRLAELTVGGVRHLRTALGEAIPHGVMLDPRDGAPWHAVIFALSGRPRTKGGRRGLADIARWASL